MDKNELQKTKKTVDEISTKFNELQNELSQNNNQVIKEEVKDLIGKLDNLNQKIQKQYANMNETGDKSKSEISEMDKNIYNSIESFNDAYTKAGSIFNKH